MEFLERIIKEQKERAIEALKNDLFKTAEIHSSTAYKANVLKKMEIENEDFRKVLFRLSQNSFLTKLTSMSSKKACNINIRLKNGWCLEVRRGIIENPPEESFEYNIDNVETMKTDEIIFKNGCKIKIGHDY